jgi:predicted acetyltransferase
VTVVDAQLELRVVEPGEVAEFVRTFEPTFGRTVDGGFGDYLSQVMERDRAYAFFDSGTIVATGETWTLDLTVPGATVPLAGLTSGRVLPTHRRGGLISRLLRYRLDEAKGRGEPVAGLWPSDSAIHGRFGFAPATWSADVQVDRSHVALTEPVDPRGQVQLVDGEEATACFPSAYDAARRLTPGMVTRSPARWQAWASFDVMHGDVPSVGPRQFARWADRGYVSYRVVRRRVDRNPASTVLVGELIATDSEVYCGLWAWCFGVDLASSVVAPLRPADEPLRLMLSAPRRVVMSVADGLWLRILDVPAALAGRRYGCDGSVAIEVTDPWGYAAGTHRLAVDDGHGDCRSWSGRPDLIMSVATLSAAYLGGTTIAALASAGRVAEHTTGAVALLDRMLAVDRPPWSAWSF